MKFVVGETEEKYGNLETFASFSPIFCPIDTMKFEFWDRENWRVVQNNSSIFVPIIIFAF